MRYHLRHSTPQAVIERIRKPMGPMDKDTTRLAVRLKALREVRGWSIAETARRAGVSVSMLWKVENGQTELTYSKLAKLAAGLEVPVGELFADTTPKVRKGGRRVVDRAGTGPVIDVQDNLHRFLAADLARKHYFPCVVEVRASGSGEDGEAHGGEEFALVIEGEVAFYCEGYEPVVLQTGDSVYFDASLKHRYNRSADTAARMVCVYSHPEHARLDEVGAAQPHSRAMQAFDRHLRPVAETAGNDVGDAGSKRARS